MDRNKRQDFKDIVREVIPILKEINEQGEIKKDDILALIDKNKPVIEMGDLSIFVAVENILEVKKKIAILANDKGIKEKYESKAKYPNIMIIDFYKTILDLQQRK
jgi:YbbR domain-containing protein